MLLLNILFNTDGSLAWDNLFFLAIALLAGYLLSIYISGKNRDRKQSAALVEAENKYKQLEHEYRNYKSNIAASERQSEKSALQLGGRVKSLEGDIRALAEEKNKFHKQILEKEEEIKQYMRQLADMEDRFKLQQDSHAKAETEWMQKQKSLREELSRAMLWEQKVKTAEEEAQRAKSVVANAERRKLDAELRLKATAEYAGKVVPLEHELAAAREQHEALKKILSEKEALTVSLQEKINASQEVFSELKIVRAQLELQTENNKILRQEFELKHGDHVLLNNEVQRLKTELKKLGEENEALKTKSANEAALAHDTNA